ncbi:MAG: putative peptidoglycan glycosyltransferase FtsW [Butyribacter sp.]|nr:putative peptidoglycan glycosyltransferase FtsW [bacterium]MDY3855424.1 putative peptidoglycan glycosyltransferase FtsW [Butyribacter sp.]
MENSEYRYRNNARTQSGRPRQQVRSANPNRNRERTVFTRQYDFALLFLTIGIALFGVIMIYSAGYYTASLQNNPYRYVKSQVFSLMLGIGAMIVVSMVDYQVFMQKILNTKITLVHLLYILAIFLQTIVLVIGVDLNGAKRWLRIGPIQFQPSEVSKIAAILFIAYAVYQKRRDLDHFLGFVRIMIYMSPLIFLILLENMSSAIIVMGITFGMCFVASKKKGYFFVIIIAGVLLLAAVIFFGEGFRLARIRMWRDVENDAGAFQIRQGLYAIASGGLFGKGLGQSMQKLGFIPEAYNDMIFSVICEELGVVGAGLVILAFLVLFWRIVVIACHAPDLFGTMLCTGVMIQLAIQVVINIAVVTNTIPSTGIPLPLISYGGTSAAIIMVEMGLVLGVSRQIKQK